MIWQQDRAACATVSGSNNAYSCWGMFNVKMVKGGLTVLNQGLIRIQTRGLVVKNKSEGDWNQEDLWGLVEVPTQLFFVETLLDEKLPRHDVPGAGTREGVDIVGSNNANVIGIGQAGQAYRQPAAAGAANRDRHSDLDCGGSFCPYIYIESTYHFRFKIARINGQ